jgi:hypothetical protein
MRERLELFFRGERDYLQGSLILSQAVATFAGALAPGEPKPLTVAQASFRSITACHCLVTDEKPPREAPAIASLRLRLEGGGASSLWVVEDPDRPEPPPRMPDAPGLLRSCEGNADLSAKASLAPIASFDDLVSGLIQVIRGALSDFRPGARNVWLLSLTDMALPIDPTPFAHGARVTLTLEGTRRRGGRNVIVEQIVLEGDEPALLGGDEPALLGGDEPALLGGAAAPPVTLRMLCSWEGDLEGS